MCYGVADKEDVISMKNTLATAENGKGRTGAFLCEEQQIYIAVNQALPLAENLMEKICEKANLNQAYKRVKSNKGAAGVDGMPLESLSAYIRSNKETLIRSLLDGSYQPQPVRGIKIPKPDGGERQLGIPTVVDRVFQQAIAQVLEPIFDPKFSESSFGFRAKRSAHQALKQAGKYVSQGYGFVVDIDLDKFFDRVNHDILMSRLARVIGDKRLLKIIRGFLTAGIMANGVCMRRAEGTPQGGPLSPLLSNILLDELDKELERRGHKFCRYADDCNVYVKSQKAGERVLESIRRFLSKTLKLKVNEEKSAVARVEKRKFLGYTLKSDGCLKIAKASLERVCGKIKLLTKRNRGMKLEQVIRDLNKYLLGWLNYFQLSDSKKDIHGTGQLDTPKASLLSAETKKTKLAHCHIFDKHGSRLRNCVGPSKIK